jgi:hypothetical protein
MSYKSKSAKLLQATMQKVAARNPDAPVFVNQPAPSRFQIVLRGISAAQDGRDAVNMIVDAGVAAANGTSVAQLIALDIDAAQRAEANPVNDALLAAFLAALAAPIAPAPSKYSLAYAMQQWPNNFVTRHAGKVRV